MVDRETVEQVAENARLNLDGDELETFRGDLEDILDAFESLDEIDTEGVEPAFHPIEVGDRKRDDEREESFSQEEALANTKNKEDGFFKGPRATE
ncbi:MAG: Asp-tRNA(Asn)/Glu-tRNA(Gln) amidotransferase subunit GatC [Candidatus Nanohaloarchaea archaeon]|nr:Asp-tRNA(Asn)/Glu-tRNA(Gln) amidotransferase subunit GatC [Candidatus Nanohaloarchaea archaeon]